MTRTADLPTLTSRLDDSVAHLATLAPAELLGVLKAEQERLVATDDASARVQVGHEFPQAQLPDAHGRLVPVVDGPTVVVFYRGAWCPFCNVALGAYQRELLPELEELGVRFVALSPQGPSGSAEIAQSNDLTFPVLTDTGSRLAHVLGLDFELADDVSDVHRALGNDFSTINAGGEWGLPRPTVVVVDAARVVTFVDVQADYTRRTEPAAILAAVRALD